MAHIEERTAVSLEEPALVEGLPGTGLVGKIAADHLVETFDMTHHADVHCEGLPPVAVYRGEESAVRAPVRFYADADRDLLVLQSDVPISPSSATEFASCVTGWLETRDALPLYLSGLPVEDPGDVPELYGIATEDAEPHLDDAGIVPPRQGGVVSGPTGALLSRAHRSGLDAIGLIVETQPQFPDPTGAKVILEGGVGPITGIDVDTDKLLERAEEIREAREQLARRLQDAGDESSQAQPIRGFQ